MVDAVEGWTSGRAKVAGLEQAALLNSIDVFQSLSLQQVSDPLFHLLFVALCGVCCYAEL